MKTSNKLLFIISDTHIGSTVGLWPKDFISNEGNPIGCNKFQNWLYDCWEDMNKWAAKILAKDSYDVVHCGDATEGIAHRTIQVMTPDIGDQVTAVKQLLEPVVLKASKVHFIKGTECHTHTNEGHIGRHFGASRDPSTGQHAWDSLDIEVHGTLCNFAHHISTTARPYLEASAHSINLGALAVSRARAGKRVPTVMVRGHRHRHGVWNDGNLLSVTLGAWQGLTRFGYKVVPDAIPQPSAVILDWRNVEKGDLPTVHQKVYTPS